MAGRQASVKLAKPTIGPPSKTARRDAILANLRHLAADSLKAAPADIDEHLPFLQIGG